MIDQTTIDQQKIGGLLGGSHVSQAVAQIHTLGATEPVKYTPANHIYKLEFERVVFSQLALPPLFRRFFPNELMWDYEPEDLAPELFLNSEPFRATKPKHEWEDDLELI